MPFAELQPVVVLLGCALVPLTGIGCPLPTQVEMLSRRLQHELRTLQHKRAATQRMRGIFCRAG